MPVRLEPGLVNDRLRGSIIHKGAQHLIIGGQLKNGNLAGFLCDANGRRVSDKLVPVSPENENYKAMMATVKRIEALFPAPVTGTSCAPGGAQGQPSHPEAGQDTSATARGSRARPEPTAQVSLFGQRP